jgi:hypothetical protein
MRIEIWSIDNRVSWRDPYTWFSWIIQLFSWWNHSAIRITTKYADFVIHAQARVVREDFEVWAKKADRSCFVQTVSNYDVASLVWLYRQLGKRYDVLAIFQQLIYQFTGWWPGRGERSTGSKYWFCSELVAAFLMRPNPHLYSPERITQHPKLVFDRVTITRKGVGEVQAAQAVTA